MSQIEFDYTITPKRKPGTNAKATITEIKEVKAVDVFEAAAKCSQYNSVISSLILGGILPRSSMHSSPAGDDDELACYEFSLA